IEATRGFKALHRRVSGRELWTSRHLPIELTIDSLTLSRLKADAKRASLRFLQVTQAAFARRPNDSQPLRTSKIRSRKGQPLRPSSVRRSIPIEMPSRVCHRLRGDRTLIQ